MNVESGAQPLSGRDLIDLNQRLSAQAAELTKLNQDLLDGEQRLRLALETGRIGFWVWNSTDVGNSGDWSPRLKEIFGLPPETEVTHELFLSCVHPEDRERVNKAVMDALAGVNEGYYQEEYRTISAKDGSLHWVTARAQAFLDSEGKPFRFIGTLMEITDRKRAEQDIERANRELEERVAQRTSELRHANAVLMREIEEREKAEQALRRSDADFRRVLDGIPGLVWSSLPDGHIDYLNKSWLKYTGLEAEEAVGWGWQRAVHKDDLPGLVDYWKSILVSEVAGQYEARMRTAEGNYRWVLFRGVPFRDGEGKVIKWYGTNMDVQELRASEHLAKGQLSTLAKTLELLSQETDPEQLPRHVVTTIADQMNAHSVTVWERNGRSLDIVGTYEDRRFRTSEEIKYFGGSIPVFAEAPSLLTEGLQAGQFALIEDLSRTPVQFTMADGRVAVWDKENLTPSFIALKTHLLSEGVRAMLVAPLMLGGALAGIIGIRFRGSRVFRDEEIALTRALAHQAMLALQLMRLSRKSRAAAVNAERNRLAQEMHDTLAQGLTGIIVQLEAAEDAKSKELALEADQHLERAARLARESLHEARASVHALRPPALTEKHLCSVLADMIEQTTKGTGLTGEFIVEGEPARLPEAWEQNLLRMVQEGLANTMRHARASRFCAKLVFSVPEIRLELSDNGRGFNPNAVPLGLGLRGMRERTEGMGGILKMENPAEGGTFICASFPTIRIQP